jgi:hypothetical protein
MAGKILSALVVAEGEMEIYSEFDIPKISDDDGLLKVEMVRVFGCSSSKLGNTQPYCREG